MAGMAHDTPNARKIVEKGDMFFFYRPRVDSDETRDLEGVQRFYLVLRPARKHPRMRVLTIGRKRLPDVAHHERSWGFVDLVTRSTRMLGKLLGEERDKTKMRGLRRLPPARPAGEGVYLFARIGHSLFLAYELDLPRRAGPVQDALDIAPRASFALSIKNPAASAPPGTGLGENEEADYPPQLLREFRGRRFASEDLRLLDSSGAEFILVGAARDPARAADIDAERQTAESADLFRTLHLAREHHPIEPLLTGSGR